MYLNDLNTTLLNKNIASQVLEKYALNAHQL